MLRNETVVRSPHAYQIEKSNGQPTHTHTHIESRLYRELPKLKCVHVVLRLGSPIRGPRVQTIFQQIWVFNFIYAFLHSCGQLNLNSSLNHIGYTMRFLDVNNNKNKIVNKYLWSNTFFMESLNRLI